MTKEQAEAKAAALTAAGVETRATKNASLPGGYATRNCKKSRISNTRYARSEKGCARDRRSHRSEKGRASHRAAVTRYQNTVNGQIKIYKRGLARRRVAKVARIRELEALLLG